MVVLEITALMQFEIWDIEPYVSESTRMNLKLLWPSGYASFFCEGVGSILTRHRSLKHDIKCYRYDKGSHNAYDIPIS